MMRLLKEQFDESSVAPVNMKSNLNNLSKGDGIKRSTAVFTGPASLVNAKLKKQLKAVDATSILKNEIAGSQLRVKAAKYGHKLEDIAPPYSDAFYLPDKTQYFQRLDNAMLN